MAMNERPTVATVDPSNDSLRFKHGKLSKIYQRKDSEDEPTLIKGPETIFFDPKGNMFTINDDANLIKLTDVQEATTDGDAIHMTAKASIVADLGPGRPLGASFTPDGSTLYICDSSLGLTRLVNPFDPKSKVELIASSVLDNGKSTPIRLADDAVVGPKTGKVYFTDATMVAPEKDRNFIFDAMYASKVELLTAKPSGRLLQYDPDTDEVTVLVRGLWFGNGVSIDPEETYVVYTESLKLRVAKYYLKGKKKGTVEYLVNGYPAPGYFDGIDCASTKISGEEKVICYAVIISYIVPAQKLIWNLPYPIDIFVSMLLLNIPRTIMPKTEPYGGILILDPEASATDGDASNPAVLRLIQDPTGKDISHLTGITFQDKKFYLGSLKNDFVGVYDASGLL